jgi:hypothetical protein
MSRIAMGESLRRILGLSARCLLPGAAWLLLARSGYA